MASFSAELTVAGHTYPVRRCEFGFSQATDARGRVQAKVRHGLLHLTLDVPDHDQLLAWAQAAHKPLSGHVTFFETNRQAARETVSFAAGQCVGYEEVFVSGAGGDGAYVCQLTLTSAGLTLAPGGPAGAFVAPAAREHAAPVAAVVEASPHSASASEFGREGIDLMRFSREKKPLEERPQSSKTGYLGSPRMTRKELATLSSELKLIGVTLVIDKKGILPGFARAGFNPTTGTLYLRKGATYFEAFHETQHAEQWAQLGSAEYSKQSRFEREKYVFDKIYANKSSFSDAEIIAATNYINSLA